MDTISVCVVSVSAVLIVKMLISAFVKKPEPAPTAPQFVHTDKLTNDCYVRISEKILHLAEFVNGDLILTNNDIKRYNLEAAKAYQHKNLLKLQFIEASVDQFLSEERERNSRSPSWAIKR